MNDILVFVLAGLAGCVLGAIFFGGLWWTVRRGLGSRHPALWFFGSLVLRLAIVLVGLYFVADGHWERLLTCLAGFLIARALVIRLAGPLPPARSGAAEETRDAP